jgi:hypothetical protein
MTYQLGLVSKVVEQVAHLLHSAKALDVQVLHDHLQYVAVKCVEETKLDRLAVKISESRILQVSSG